MINWILKQIFYFRYLVLEENHHIYYLKELDMYYELSDVLEYLKYSFKSCSFTDDQWLEFLPWYKDSKAFQDWNTYGIFKQQYGKFYFKAKLSGLIQVNELQGTYVPAIWLLDMRSQNDVNEGRGDHPYYYEVDIELMRNHFIYSIHISHNGEKEFETIWRSQFANRKLRRNLQNEYHLFLIDWSEKYIRFYINGILSACFKNEIHTPLQVVMSKLDMSKVIVQK